MYKNNNNLVFSCKYHIVWCTKYRKQVLHYPVDGYLKKILFSVSQEFQCTIIELEVMPDHVHILVKIDPQFKVSKLIKIMKGRSSRYLRNVFKELKTMPSLWTNSIFISTVGGAPLEVVKHYIRNQKHVFGKKA